MYSVRLNNQLTLAWDAFSKDNEHLSSPWFDHCCMYTAVCVVLSIAYFIIILLYYEFDIPYHPYAFSILVSGKPTSLTTYTPQTLECLLLYQLSS